MAGLLLNEGFHVFPPEQPSFPAPLLKIALEGFAETRGAAIMMGPPSMPNRDEAEEQTEETEQ